MGWKNYGIGQFINRVKKIMYYIPFMQNIFKDTVLFHVLDDIYAKYI